MFALLKARLGGAFKTKVGIALIGALVVGGGGTVMAMATSQGQPRSNLVAPRTSASSTAHSDDSSNATKAAGQDDQDDQDCTGSATGAIASPTAHSDDSSSATKVAGQDDQEASENENAQDEQNENAQDEDEQNETECQSSSESP